MERKIGEIFEYNGEWYQCIVGNDCENCAFNERKCYTVVDNDDPIGDCCDDRRKDNKDVIFKKLEKVGEPTIINRKKVQLLKSSGLRNNCIYCCFLDKNSSRCLIPKMEHENETFYVEIKQKEDMKLAITIKKPCHPKCLYELTGDVYTTTKTYLIELGNLPKEVVNAINEVENEGCVSSISFVKEEQL